SSRILLAPRNLGLREDHLLAGSALHLEDFQEQRPNSQKLLVRFQLASSRPSSSAEINTTRLAPFTTGSAPKLGTVILFSALTTRAPGASAATSWLVDKFPTAAGVKFPALP